MNSSVRSPNLSRASGGFVALVAINQPPFAVFVSSIMFSKLASSALPRGAALVAGVAVVSLSSD